MGRKKSPEQVINDNYWAAMKQSGLSSEYAAFLRQENMESSPHAANVFAARRIRESGGISQYMGMTERQIILALVGELPYMYD